jgi:hypothetical protein
MLYYEAQTLKNVMDKSIFFKELWDVSFSLKSS